MSTDPLEQTANSARERLIGPPALTIWVTGLPASGKTTLAYALNQRLLTHSLNSYVLDGDQLRRALCSDLDYTPSAQKECARRASETAILLSKTGCIPIISMVTPYRDDRDAARKAHHINGSPFIEVFVNTPLETCKKRDTQDLYSSAENSKLLDFVGVSMPFEAPLNPEVIINTEQDNPNISCEKIFDFLYKNNFLSPYEYIDCNTNKKAQ
ncbi:MAG: adenylyl-sulfate kinase [Gammaproteobacteria bacterium]|nr:MAG: adenylyl-sulfate kinase [Gammaproteobacteria bacterium]